MDSRIRVYAVKSVVCGEGHPYEESQDACILHFRLEGATFSDACKPEFVGKPEQRLIAVIGTTITMMSWIFEFGGELYSLLEHVAIPDSKGPHLVLEPYWLPFNDWRD